MFITIEGGEGTGKTSQTELLRKWWEAKGVPVISTHDPRGTILGERVMDVLNAEPCTHSLTELALFTAARFEHIETVIRPALATNTVVISDRYIDSTYAYQVGGRGIDPSVVDEFIKHELIDPDYTFVLDMEPANAIHRIRQKFALDRFESEDMSYHNRVREEFLRRAEADKRRCHVIPVDGLSKEAVHRAIVNVLGG